MRQPDFWYQARGFRSSLLKPLSALYALQQSRRLKAGLRVSSKIPVICVGNLHVGGGGKTPTALAIAKRLIGQGHRPHFITRGFGGSASNPLQVDLKKHHSKMVGDEPLLLASVAPTWVAADRIRATRCVEQTDATVIVLDDGFQDPSLNHDLSIIVVDARRGFGNGEVLPAGPLREPVQQGLARADLLLVVGDESQYRHLTQQWSQCLTMEVTRARLKVIETGINWENMRLVAFAGIADPEKFFLTLREIGGEIIQEFPLSDHAPIDTRMLHRMATLAKAKDASLVTTEKDAVRLPDSWRTRVLSLPIHLNFEDEERINQCLERLVCRA